MAQIYFARQDGADRTPTAGICIRRFNVAADRLNLEDSLADLAIVAEALFLSDTSTERGELGFRLKIRAAKILEKDGCEYSEVLIMFAKLYALRSRIVHGDNLPQSVTVSGTPMHINEFFNKSLVLMRRALLCSIDGFRATRDFATIEYWERITFER